MSTSSTDPLPLTDSQLFFKNYWDIIGGLFFAGLAIFIHFQHLSVYFATIFAAVSIALLSVTVAEIAEILAERLEEPYGSFVLTFSAVAVEIILLLTILLQATHSPSALDTVKGGIISAVIVDMNVLLGLAVFIGGLSFKEQEHNEDTSSTYTTILLVAAAALLVPSILSHTSNSHSDLIKASVIISVVLFLFYIIIYIFQTRTHSHFFKATARSRLFRLRSKKNEHGEEEFVEDSSYLFEKASTWVNFLMIFVIIGLIGLTAEVFAADGLKVFEEFGISAGLAGLIIAIISVSPEIFTAIRAARNDQMQRVVNIAMGASTVSIMLTVPSLMLLAYLNDIELSLDFNTLQVGALILTIILAWKTTDDGETNYFEGSSHLMFFICYAIITAFY